MRSGERLRPLAVALAASLVAAAVGCRVDPFEARGKTCHRDDRCPKPLDCVLSSQSQTSSGGENDGGAGAEPAQTGVCEIVPCTEVRCGTPGDVCVADACYPAQCPGQSCGPNEVCSGGQCVDRSCLGVSCDAGTACAQGSCRPLHCTSGACNADAGELCFEAACADRRCIGVPCPEDYGCVQGRCYPESCNGTVCPGGALCKDNQCTERACIGVSCTAGLLCAKGVCQGCPPGSNQAADGGCVPLLDAGLPCGAGGDCKSGHCVNGNCCEAASCGACQRCDVPGQRGACAPAPDGGPSCGGCGVGSPCVTGQCEGGVCLVTHALNVDLDAWVGLLANKAYGNGKGPRLVVGGARFAVPVTEIGRNRVLLRIPLILADGGAPEAGTIASARLKLRVKPIGSDNCWSTKAGVMFFVEELDGGFTENSYSAVCGSSSNGASSALWPGPAGIPANRAKFESGGTTPSGWISVDVRPMVAAARLAGKTRLEVRLIGAGAGEEVDETTESRRLTLHSRESTVADAGPYLELKLIP